MKYKAVIFDLDGTLVSTESIYRHNVVNSTLRELGLEGASGIDIDLFWFGHKRDEVIAERFNIDPKRFWKVFRKKDVSDSRIKFTKPYDDVDFIDELKQNGFKTGIVTGAPFHIAYPEVNMIGYDKFDAVIISNTFRKIKEKPNPDGLEECLKKIDVKKDEAIYVGNAEEDITTAKNAGVFDVLIVRGDYAVPALRASLTICSLYELRIFLNVNSFG